MTWFDTLIYGVRHVLSNGATRPPQSTLNFGSPFVVADNDGQARTDITIPSADAATPGAVPLTGGAHRILVAGASGVLRWTPRHYGEIYLTAAALTDVAAVNTPIKVSGTTALTVTPSGFAMPANNRLTYEDKDPIVAYVSATVSAERSATSWNGLLTIAKNDAPIASSAMAIQVVEGPRVTTLSSLVTLAEDDYVEVWVENVTDAEDMITSNLLLSAHQIATV